MMLFKETDISYKKNYISKYDMYATFSSGTFPTDFYVNLHSEKCFHLFVSYKLVLAT
jgi:hypothetical protein